MGWVRQKGFNPFRDLPHHRGSRCFALAFATIDLPGFPYLGNLVIGVTINLRCGRLSSPTVSF